MPICLVSACLLGNGHGGFGAPGWGEWEGAEPTGGGQGGGGRERDAERETERQTAKQMAARGGGVPAGRGRRELDGANQFPQLLRG